MTGVSMTALTMKMQESYVVSSYRNINDAIICIVWQNMNNSWCKSFQDILFR